MKEFSLSKIAFEFNYSKEHLSRLFKLSTATTINSYISSIRVAKAKELLLLTDFTIAEISKMVGMEDDKYFYRLFKKHEKITPKEFRYSYNKVHLNIK